MTTFKYACAVVKPTIGAGVSMGSGLLSDASFIVRSSSSKLSSIELEGKPASMHSVRWTCQLWAMPMILCRRRNEMRFHHSVLLAVITSTVVVEEGRIEAEVRR